MSDVHGMYTINLSSGNANISAGCVTLDGRGFIHGRVGAVTLQTIELLEDSQVRIVAHEDGCDSLRTLEFIGTWDSNYGVIDARCTNEPRFSRLHLQKQPIGRLGLKG